MAQEIIYPYGSKAVNVTAGEYLEVAALEGKAKIYLGVDDPNMPLTYTYSQTIENEQVTLGTYSTDQMVRIDAKAGPVYYNTGAAPEVVVPFTETPVVYQGTPTAATVTATLTPAQLRTGIITDQGGGAAVALTLPDGADMDDAFPDIAIDQGFDVSVINISTAAADVITMTSPGADFTIVGNAIIAANTAVTDNSQGLFRARRTAADTWVLYRMA